jgi:cytochrome c-type biogenesis protein CcmH
VGGLARWTSAAGGEDSERAAREIARTLKCPVCQNLSVADSPSELAQQMRDLIRKNLAAGESAEQIVAYFVERYGPEVLATPPREGFNQALWWGPLAILAVGAAAVGTTLRRWTRAAAPPEALDAAGAADTAVAPATQGGSR